MDLLGWTPLRWAEQEGYDRLYAELSLGTVTGDAVTCFFPRDDAPPGRSTPCWGQSSTA